MMKLKTMNERYLMRSATAPETIVAAVPANTSWKKNLAPSGTPVQLMAAVDALVVGGRGRAVVRALQHPQPFGADSTGVPLPNIRPQPSSQKPIDVTANTMKFFDRMLTQFLCPAHARFDAGKAEVHEEHQHAGDHDPHRVDHDLQLGVRRRRGRSCWRWRRRLGRRRSGRIGSGGSLLCRKACAGRKARPQRQIEANSNDQ